MMASRTMTILLLLGLSLAAHAEVPLSELWCPEADADHAPLHRGVPAWPHVAHMMCLEGTVVVEFTIAADGSTRNPAVVDTDQPGVFDRVALNAVRQWVYRPRCENGVPVESEQRTALDFFLEDDFQVECLAGAALLTGDAQELASALGVLYSMLAEWYMNPSLMELPDQIRAALVPAFADDLGRVERFHHETIRELLAFAEDRQDNRPLGLRDLLGAAMVFGARSWSLPERALTDVRAGATVERAQRLALRATMAQRFETLLTEVDLDPDLLEVLVRPFLGDVLAENGEQEINWKRQLDLTDTVLDLLEDPGVAWVVEPHGFSFEQDADQTRFDELVAEFLAVYQRNHQDFQRAMLGFMDYLP